MTELLTEVWCEDCWYGAEGLIPADARGDAAEGLALALTSKLCLMIS